MTWVFVFSLRQAYLRAFSVRFQVFTVSKMFRHGTPWHAMCRCLLLPLSSQCRSRRSQLNAFSGRLSGASCIWTENKTIRSYMKDYEGIYFISAYDLLSSQLAVGCETYGRSGSTACSGSLYLNCSIYLWATGGEV